ncbi:MAG: phage tail tube protein [Elusimicrobiaceae bacterium]|jgi:hypothetical protein|nr:phage tail tube protein [Elusimicrobiaceae bacterium]
MAEVVNKILRGTFGRLWAQGKRLANVKSFEAKATLKYEAVEINGELCEQQRYLGYSLAGTIVVHKTDTYLVNLILNGMVTGSMPPIKLVGRLADPDANGSERVEIYDVTFDEATLMQFENATVSEESVPFKAGGFRYLDKIL